MRNIDILQRDNDIAGLCSFIWTMFDMICNSIITNHAIPIVDMKNLNNYQFHDNYSKEKINVWEDYFEQPYNISLDDIKDDDICNVIKQKNFTILQSLPIQTQQQFAKNFLRVKKDICKLAEEFYINNCNSNTVGVLIRGTDYRNLKPIGHPKQPLIENVISDCKHLLNNNGISNIFLMTESFDIATIFKKEFPGLVIQFQDQMLPSINGLICDFLKDKSYEFKLKLNTQYLVSLLILCKCNNVLLSNTSAMEVYKFMRQITPKTEKIYNLSYYC